MNKIKRDLKKMLGFSKEEIEEFIKDVKDYYKTYGSVSFAQNELKKTFWANRMSPNFFNEIILKILKNK